MPITKLVSLTGLTKLPVADCLKLKCSHFRLGLQLQRTVPFWFGRRRCSPRLSVWTLCDVKFDIIAGGTDATNANEQTRGK